MANNEALIRIPGRLHSVATEGHVAGANEIYDDSQGKLQSAINADVQMALGTGGTVDFKIAVEKNRAEGAEQANSTAITNEVSRAQNAESALGNRITPLEEAVGTGGTIDQRIENATKNTAYIDASDEGSETVNW